MTQEEFRGRFPVFSGPRTHLVSCSSGALSVDVAEAIETFMTSWRHLGAPWDAWMDEVMAARSLWAHAIGADPRDVASLSCLSECAYQAVSNERFDADRPEILSSVWEFPSVAHVWLAQEARGAQVRLLPTGSPDHMSVEAYVEAISPRTRLVSIPLAAYANGHRLEVARVAARAHAMGAHVFVDAYQGAGVVPLDVHALGADYVAAGALKYLLGSPGLAWLWVDPNLPVGPPPQLTGWFGRENPFAFDPGSLTWGPGAHRFETGTPSIPAAYAAAAALRLLGQLDPIMVWRHVAELAEHLDRALRQEGFAVTSPREAAHRGPMVAVATPDSRAAAERLLAEDILVSPRGEAIRLSLHYYNQAGDIRNAVTALVRLADEDPFLLPRT